SGRGWRDEPAHRHLRHDRLRRTRQRDRRQPTGFPGGVRPLLRGDHRHPHDLRLGPRRVRAGGGVPVAAGPVGRPRRLRRLARPGGERPVGRVGCHRHGRRHLHLGVRDSSRRGGIVTHLDTPTARYLVGDVFERMAELEDGSVDLIMTSPPFLALRSYLPADHPDKAKEIGSETSPAEYLNTLLRLTAEWGRLLAPHGSICVELGDTYAGSGGGGGDFYDGGLRAGQPG